MQSAYIQDNDLEEIIQLNVRGIVFETEKRHLLEFEDSALNAMFSGRWDNQAIDGQVLMDRDPLIFRYLLGYLQQEDKDVYPTFTDPDLKLKVQEEFDFYDIPWEDFKMLDSKIVNTDELKKWTYINLTDKKVPKLIYRGSRDGFRASDFHRNCDGKA